jgi:hypothetical protein
MKSNILCLKQLTAGPASAVSHGLDQVIPGGRWKPSTGVAVGVHELPAPEHAARLAAQDRIAFDLRWELHFLQKLEV